MNSLKKLMLSVVLCTSVLHSCKLTKEQNNTPWVHLINDDNTEGWSILGGEATYKVENGVVIGTTVANTPNTFLTTNKKYGDFIFEIEYKVSPFSTICVFVEMAVFTGNLEFDTCATVSIELLFVFNFCPTLSEELVKLFRS